MTMAALRSVLLTLLGTALCALLLFSAAGTLGWAQGWAFVAVWTAASLAPDLALLRDLPQQLERRSTSWVRLPPLDRALQLLQALLVLAVVGVGGLDAGRLGWSELPQVLVYPGTALVLGAGVGSAWVQLVNPFYETAFLAERDRRHKVVGWGPYGWCAIPATWRCSSR